MSASLFAGLVAAAIFVTLLALAAILLVLSSSRQARRLRRRLAGEAPGPADEGDGAGGSAVLQEFARHGRAIEQLVDKEGETARLMIQAGWRDAGARLLFNAFQFLMPLVAVAAVAAGGMFSSNHWFELPQVLIVGVAAAIVGILLPRWLLRNVARRRRLKLEREVPLFVHILVLLFEAGLSTRQALATIVRDGHGVLPQLGKEIDVVLRQLDAGSETAETLRRMGDALEVPDLVTILGVLRQVDRYGGEVREPLVDALARAGRAARPGSAREGRRPVGTHDRGHGPVLLSGSAGVSRRSGVHRAGQGARRPMSGRQSD
jgi:tight adherence protein C